MTPSLANIRHMGRWRMMFRQTPILPKEVCKPGTTSKVGLHEHKGSPVFVVAKMPRHKKLRPGKEDDGVRWLHTTWVLRNGKWELESRDEEPSRSNNVITYWVDRAVFLFRKAGQATANGKGLSTHCKISRNKLLKRFHALVRLEGKQLGSHREQTLCMRVLHCPHQLVYVSASQKEVYGLHELLCRSVSGDLVFEGKHLEQKPLVILREPLVKKCEASLVGQQIFGLGCCHYHRACNSQAPGYLTS